jgi:hypothetical protein
MNENLRLFEVLDSAAKKEFLNLPVALYKSDINYIRPLDIDVEKVFNPSTNKFFRTGECIRWILKNGDGKTIGRVAAFLEKTVSKKQDQPTGGMGFFECIKDQAAANILFDACKNWLQERGMEAMDGPVNFGDRDRWWGCLLKASPSQTIVFLIIFLITKTCLKPMASKITLINIPITGLLILKDYRTR